MRTLQRDRAALVIVDVQEAFRPVVEDFDDVVAATRTLIEGAKVLDIPIVVTEQYPKGLGKTVEELQEPLSSLMPFEKTAFSAAQADGFDLQGKTQALICGIETHVCVSQTAHDLIENGVEVHIAADAVSSRTAENKQIGLHKMERSGAIVTSVETALFELLGAAGTPEFKEVQRLVK